jgi:tRNA(His) guanylyltransferase
MQRISGKTISWEIYSSLKARPPLIVRADGRGFKKILEDFKKPYDLNFAQTIADATAKIFEDSGLAPAFAYTFSDEISLVFINLPFSGRVEKMDSLVAGSISGIMSLSLKRAVSFDCRAIPVCKAEIQEYLEERQEEAWRNHVFSYGFYSLVENGLTNTKAMEQLRGYKEQEIHELVFKNGVNLAKTPAWERRGILIHRKEGRIFQNWDVPLFKSKEGRNMVDLLIGSD